MYLINVGKLMSRSVQTVHADDKLAEVVHIMHANRISCAVVVEGNQPVGIVTETDLVRILDEVLREKNTKYTPVSAFMSAPVLTVQEATGMYDALVLCRGHRIRHLPVVDEKGDLCGLLSYTDLAKAYELIVQEERAIIESEVRHKTLELQEANERLKALSMEDALLGIGNRRSMGVDLSYTHNLAIRYKRPYSVVLFDVDSFKRYNDHYGHQAGDDALKLVTEHIRNWIRKSDRLYRYGGEELLLLLPETELEGAMILASRIVQELAERNIPHAGSQHNVLTISAGIGAPDLNKDRGGDWKAVVQQADQGLYMAKVNGRNQVCSPAQLSAFLQ